MTGTYDPAGTVAAENWPIWKNALAGAVVLIAVAFVVTVMGRPVDVERSKAERAIAYCETELSGLRSEPGVSAGEVALMRAACQNMRDSYHAAWDRDF